VLALVVLWPFLVPETGRIRILRGGLAAGLGLCSVVVAVSAAAGAQDSPLAAVLVPFQAVGLVVGVGLSLVGLPVLAVAAPLGDAGLLVMSAICLTAILASIALVARTSGIGLRGRFAALASLIVALVAVGAFATFLLGPDHWGPIEFQDVIDSMAAGFLLVAAIAALAWIARVIRVWPARTGDHVSTTSGDTQDDDLDAVTQREPLGQASFRRSLPGSASARKERPVNLKVMTTRWRVAITIGFVIGAVTGWGSESKYTADPTGILAYAILNGLFWAVFVLVVWGLQLGIRRVLVRRGEPKVTIQGPQGQVFQVRLEEAKRYVAEEGYTYTLSPAVRAPSMSVADEVAKLVVLRDNGTITEAEFQQQRALLLPPSPSTGT
jgi:hypothetical protein